MDIFTGTLGALIVACSLMQYYSRSATSKAAKDANFTKFQNNYLIVYMLAMMGDWLQGPVRFRFAVPSDLFYSKFETFLLFKHVYALYESYNMSKHEIELLFIAGFGSSMLFGTIIGSFADK